MHPILIDLGTHDLPLLGEKHLFLPSYGVLFACGVLIAWVWLMRRAGSMGLDRDEVFNLTFYSLLAGLVGAKLTLIAVDWQYYLSDWRNLLGTLRSAGVLMGGVLVGSLTFALYCVRSGLPLLALGDAVAAPLALAQAIGRLGCFSAGCCYGVRGDGWWAITFTSADAHAQTGVPLNVALVPTQFIQMVNDLTLAMLLTWLWRRSVRQGSRIAEGTVFWIYVLLYSISRGTIEFWRGDVHRGLYLDGHVSTSQMFSAAGVVVAATMLLVGWQRRREASA